MIRSDGLGKVKEEKETWLTEASQKGSGDDITLGVLCRMDALRRPTGRVPAGQLPSIPEQAMPGESQDPTKPPSESPIEGPGDTVPPENIGEGAP